jgi:hypothetical protein
MKGKRLMIFVTIAVLVVGSATQPRLAATQDTDTAVTMWFAVFNNPDACMAGGPGVCGTPDLQNAAAQPALVYGSGQRVRGEGPVSFAASLTKGSTLGAQLGSGLLDPAKAEIHVVLRSHGPVLPDVAQLGSQISIFNGGCPPNACGNLQVAVHRPSEADASGRSTSSVRLFGTPTVVPDASSTLWRRENGVIAVLHTELP